MRLVRAHVPSFDRPVLARIDDDRAIVLAEESTHVAADVLRETLADGIELNGTGLAEVDAAQLNVLTPVRNPGRIICTALNYGAHAAETGRTPPEEPMFFPKFTRSLVAPNAVVQIPDAVLSNIDYEGELAIIVGATATRVGVDDALDHVLGYTVANDVSARTQQRADGQYWRGKGSDGLCPLGPSIVTVDDLGDASSLRLTTTVNGELRQSGSTSDLIFGVCELLAFLTRFITLEAGDVLLTGTPPGVGIAMNPPQFLGDGDEVTVDIEGIGALTSTVRMYAEPRP